MDKIETIDRLHEECDIGVMSEQVPFMAKVRTTLL